MLFISPALTRIFSPEASCAHLSVPLPPPIPHSVFHAKIVLAVHMVASCACCLYSFWIPYWHLFSVWDGATHEILLALSRGILFCLRVCFFNGGYLLFLMVGFFIGGTKSFSIGGILLCLSVGFFKSGSLLISISFFCPINPLLLAVCFTLTSRSYTLGLYD